MTRFRTRQFTPRPEKIVTAQDRGQALRNWFDTHTTSIKAFAAAAGIPRSTLNTYLTGSKDLAYLPQERAGALIEALDLTDYEAWEVLGIPEGAKSTFRTFRPAPTGHGQPVKDVIEIRLTEPMVGEIPLPLGSVVRIDPNDASRPFQVVRLEDGRLYSVTSLLLSRAGGTRLGGLLSAHF